MHRNADDYALGKTLGTGRFGHVLLTSPYRNLIWKKTGYKVIQYIEKYW